MGIVDLIYSQLTKKCSTFSIEDLELLNEYFLDNHDKSLFSFKLIYGIS